MVRFTSVCVALCILSGAFALPGQTPKYKAIWEPVNYKADLCLMFILLTSRPDGLSAEPAKWPAE